MKVPDDGVALLTGGGSGLGAATAQRLAEAGWTVVVADLASSPADALAADLTATGLRASAVVADVTDAGQVHAAVEHATSVGDLRVVVCCAGIATPGRLLSRRGPLDLEAARRVVEVNLLGTITTLAAVTPAMVSVEPDDGERGVIVLTASVAAFDGQIGQVAYAASKAGVAGLALPAARDLAQHLIRVVSIAPGVFDTAMMAGMGTEVREVLESLVPHPARLGDPEEYAALVEHIVANPMLNGETIRLDGALRMPPR